MTPAFEARCLLRGARSGTLATQNAGQPHAALVTPAVDGGGSVLLLLSALADHTKHLLQQGRCALMVAGSAVDLNPQTAPRLTLIGTAAQDHDPALRRHWLLRHPYASLYADFPDFSLWRLVPEAALYVAGFGRAIRLGAAELAAPDHVASALRAAEPGIVAHCNEAHANALSRLAHASGGAGRWRMLGFDCDGFDLYQDEAVMRIAFAAPIAEAAEAQAALEKLLGGSHH